MTGWIECDAVGAVAMIVIAVGLSGISMAGWAVNHLDLAPPFAGFYVERKCADTFGTMLVA